MAGVKGKSGGPRKNAGGARPGAGRKPKEPVVTSYADPLDFLRAVWTGEVDASATQVRAAQAALPFKHQKLGEGGKKEQRQDAAKKVAGRFKSAAPPKLVAAGGKKV
jgi:phage terminase small subunit